LENPFVFFISSYHFLLPLLPLHPIILLFKLTMPATDVKPPQQRSTTRTKTGRGGRSSKSTATADRSSTPNVAEDEESKDAVSTTANSTTAASGAASSTPEQTLASTEVNALYPGLNDMADALEALPMELIRHFTLLREIDAKCIVTMPELNRLIKDVFKLPIPDPAEVHLVQEREQILDRIRQLIRELMPCLEEKMHVAGVAAEAISRHVARLDYDYNDLIIGQNEIPHIVRYGPKEHPAYLPIVTPAEQKHASSTRSESRREAMAAKKAAAAAAKADAAAGTDSNNPSTRGRGTPRPDEKTGGSKSGSSTRGTNGSGSKSGSGSTNSKQTSSSATTSSSSSSTNKRRKAASSSTATTPIVESAELAGSDSKGSAQTGEGFKQEYGDDGESSVAAGSKRNRSGNGSSSSRKRAAHGNGASATAASESARSSRASKSSGKNSDDKVSSSNGTSNSRRRGGSNKRGDDYEEFEEYEEDEVPEEGDANEEQVYCYCQQVSFGEMVGCDGPDCKIEWFHLPCIGLSQPPVGQWFCNDCAKKREKSGDAKGDPGSKSEGDKRGESTR
jgi:inhibitor of growth protein 3